MTLVKAALTLFFLNAFGGQMIVDVWDFLKETLFSLEMPQYDNFNVQSNALFSIKWIIIGVTVGIIFAAILTVYNKRYIGGFVRLLIGKDCLDESRAQTLGELGCERRPGIRSAIRSGGTLSRWVRCAEEDAYLRDFEAKKAEHLEKYRDDPHPPRLEMPTFKRDCNVMHFYIPEEMRESAEKKFNDDGADWLTVAAISVVAILICLVACYFAPDILTYVDNFISLINGI